MAFQLKENSELENFLKVLRYSFPITIEEKEYLIEDLNNMRETMEPHEPSKKLVNENIELMKFLEELNDAELNENNTNIVELKS